MTSVAVTRRHDLTDRQWAAIEPLLPAGTPSRSAADMDETTAHRCDPVADPGRDAVA